MAAGGGFVSVSGLHGPGREGGEAPPVWAPASSVVRRVAADPAVLPGPVDWTAPKTHVLTLDVQELTAEIEPGVTFRYMTFGGQVPGPLLRVRLGDTVQFTLKNPAESAMVHNIDFHAVYGTGGGADATLVAPGQSASIAFKALYPGAFIYHCAVPNLDYHISAGMFGLVLVEPPEGLPPVDHEFYLGQCEVYTNKAAGEQGAHGFDFAAMAREEPTYVLLNGQKYALTSSGFGAMQARVGETARIFFVNGGPNLTSHFHPIGNVWTKAWREGAIESAPARYAQTVAVPPGSCGVFEMEFPVPEQIKLVDHALSRVIRKGFLGVIDVTGPPQPDLFNPNWTLSAN